MTQSLMTDVIYYSSMESDSSKPEAKEAKRNRAIGQYVRKAWGSE